MQSQIIKLIVCDVKIVCILRI